MKKADDQDEEDGRKSPVIRTTYSSNTSQRRPGPGTRAAGTTEGKAEAEPADNAEEKADAANPADRDAAEEEAAIQEIAGGAIVVPKPLPYKPCVTSIPNLVWPTLTNVLVYQELKEQFKIINLADFCDLPSWIKPQEQFTKSQRLTSYWVYNKQLDDYNLVKFFARYEPSKTQSYFATNFNAY